MAWLQEIPKGSGRFYVYWRNPDTGKNEYLDRATPGQVQEHLLQEMFREKFEAEGRDANVRLTNFVFNSMRSKSETLEKGTKKEVTIEKGDKDNTINVKMGSRNFVVALGGDVFFRRDDSTGLMLPVANPTTKVEGNEVYVTFNKSFFLLASRDQTKVIAELKRSFEKHPDGPLQLADVSEKFEDVNPNGLKMFQSRFYKKLS